MYPKIHQLQALEALKALYSLPYTTVNNRTYVEMSELNKKINEYIRTVDDKEMMMVFLKTNVTNKILI